MTTTQDWIAKFQDRYQRSGQPPERFGRVIRAAAELDGVDLGEPEPSDRHVPLVRCPACGQVRAADEFETVGDEVREGTDRASDAQLTADLQRQSHGTFAKRCEDDETRVAIGSEYVDGHYENQYRTRGELKRRCLREGAAAERARDRMEGEGETDPAKFRRYYEEELDKS